MNNSEVKAASVTAIPAVIWSERLQVSGTLQIKAQKLDTLVLHCAESIALYQKRNLNGRVSVLE